ncbi:thioredoxin-like protein [Dactylonectria estremocensis]|uniref:Thioredoxin-like protein n=1 Tax=Dactylonectria estremocensis TaxID=1079267 RepID=A0A9P9FCM9_9HYPO|nr:thioredoxin-like protein [Dactylonectria estremocensis]
MFRFVSASRPQSPLWTLNYSRFTQRKTLDPITLFHKASSPASVRVASLLQKASADAAAETPNSREQFELNITEEPPTDDQVKTILEYVGTSRIADVVKGAKDEKDALRKFKESKGNFVRPVVVDWNNGAAIAGDNESEILKLLNAQK